MAEIGRGALLMLVTPDKKVMIFSGDEENRSKSGEKIAGLGSGDYRSVLGFEFPGGVVEEDESLLEGLYREVEQEIGFDVSEEGRSERLSVVGSVRLLQKREGEQMEFDVSIFEMRLSQDEIDGVIRGLPDSKEAMMLSRSQIQAEELDNIRERDRQILKHVFVKSE